MRQCPKCGKRFLADDVTRCDSDGSPLQAVVVATGRDRLVNTVIADRYEIVGVLGDGGMGVVYRARGLKDGQTYAVKVLRAEYSNEEDLVVRFQQEAEAVAQIRHPNIVRVTEFGTLPDQSRYFVMEYLSGRSLGQLLVGQGKRAKDRLAPLPEWLTLHIARQICAGLSAAHALGIVHRDMKPDNVHLIPRPDGGYTVKILDFGIAKVQGGRSARTRTGSVFGTPHYMSPEQAQGERDIDPRTDVYAAGVLLYQMACGRVPFDADNLMGILTAHLYKTPPAPRSITEPGEVSEGLEAVILKALSKKREGRYASMAALDEDLARVERNEPPQALVDADVMTAVYHREDLPSSAQWQVAPGANEKQTVPSGRVHAVKGVDVAGVPGMPAPMSASIPPITANRERAKSRAPLIAVLVGLFALGVGGGAFVMFRRSTSAMEAAPRATTQPPTVANTSALTHSQPAIEPSHAIVSDAAIAPAPVVPSQTITLMSDPPGGTVNDNGHTLGRAPMEVPRPSGADSHSYTLSAPGRLAVAVVVRADTPRAIQVTLPPRPGGESNGHASHGHPHHGELLDPWAN